jgi:hypothetical protein
MAPFLYRCPHTGRSVRAWAAEELGEDDLVFIHVTCVVCARGHQVNVSRAE